MSELMLTTKKSPSPLEQGFFVHYSEQMTEIGIRNWEGGLRAIGPAPRREYGMIKQRV